MHKGIVAIDFDNTICDVEWPRILGLKSGARSVINWLNQNNYYVIINTCRSGDNADEAEDFLIDSGVKFDRFNENHPLLIDMFGGDCRKISADLYIDDKCIHTLCHWGDINWPTLFIQIQAVLGSKKFKSILEGVK